LTDLAANSFTEWGQSPIALGISCHYEGVALRRHPELRHNHRCLLESTERSIMASVRRGWICVLILCGGACIMEKDATQGIIVDLPSASAPCGDASRELVATAIGRHRARLNEEPDATIPEVCRRLQEVLVYRAEKVVYVNAAADVSWGEFMELIDHVWPETNVVSILTPKAEALARQTGCLYPSCRDCSKLGGFRVQ
jgi:biopolymer transport protein ExbD